MSGLELPGIAARHPGETKAEISRLVQEYSLDIPAVFRSFRLVRLRQPAPKAEQAVEPNGSGGFVSGSGLGWFAVGSH